MYKVSSIFNMSFNAYIYIVVFLSRNKYNVCTLVVDFLRSKESTTSVQLYVYTSDSRLYKKTCNSNKCVIYNTHIAHTPYT